MQTPWRELVTWGLKSYELPTQEAAAAAMRAYSEVTDSQEEIDR